MNEIKLFLSSILFTHFIGYSQLTISSPNVINEGESYELQVNLNEPLDQDLYLFFETELIDTSTDDFNVSNDLMNGVYYVVDGTPVDDFTNSPFDINRHMLGMDGDTLYYEKTNGSLHKFDLFNGEVFVTELPFNSSRDIYFKNNSVYIVRDLPVSDIIEIFDNNFNLLEQVNFPQTENYDNGGIEVSNNGDMYTSQGGQHRILKFDQSTDSWSVFLHENDEGEEIFFNISDIQLIDDNKLVVVDSKLGVSLWDLEGSLLGSNYLYGYPSPSQKIDVNNNTMIISYGEENIVYSTKLSFLNDCPEKMWDINSSGIIMGDINSVGDEVNELDSPWDVEIDSKGVVYVVDHGNGSIKYKFTKPTIKIPSGELIGSLNITTESDSRIEGNETFNMSLVGSNYENFNSFNWSNNINIIDNTENIEFSVSTESLIGSEGEILDLELTLNSPEDLLLELDFSGESIEGVDFEIFSDSGYDIFEVTNNNLRYNLVGDSNEFRNGCFNDNKLYLIGGGSTEIFEYDLESQNKENLLLCNLPVGTINDVSIRDNSLFFITEPKIYQLDLITKNLTILFDNPDFSNGERYTGMDIHEEIIYVTTRNSVGGFEGVTKYNLIDESIEKININLEFPKDIQITQNFIFILDNNVYKYNHTFDLLDQTNIPGSGESRGFYVSDDEQYVYLTKLSFSNTFISTLYKVSISDNSNEIIFDNSNLGGSKMWGIIPTNNGDNFFFTSQYRVYKYLTDNFFNVSSTQQSINLDLSFLDDNLNNEGTELNSITPIFHINTNISTGDEINFSIEENGLGINENNEVNVFIYPNPTNNILNIDFENYKSSELFNISGQSILKTDKRNLDFSGFSKGVYFLTIENTDGIKTKGLKVLKE